MSTLEDRARAILNGAKRYDPWATRINGELGLPAPQPAFGIKPAEQVFGDSGSNPEQYAKDLRERVTQDMADPTRSNMRDAAFAIRQLQYLAGQGSIEAINAIKTPEVNNALFAMDRDYGNGKPGSGLTTLAPDKTQPAIAPAKQTITQKLGF